MSCDVFSRRDFLQCLLILIFQLHQLCNWKSIAVHFKLIIKGDSMLQILQIFLWLKAANNYCNFFQYSSSFSSLILFKREKLMSSFKRKLLFFINARSAIFISFLCRPIIFKISNVALGQVDLVNSHYLQVVGMICAVSR